MLQQPPRQPGQIADDLASTEAQVQAALNQIQMGLNQIQTALNQIQIGLQAVQMVVSNVSRDAEAVRRLG